MRLSNYNYLCNGFYFVTICTHNRKHWFGNIAKGEMVLNRYGTIVKKSWVDLPKHYSNCVLDNFVIMPNHIHGIVVMDNCNKFPVGEGLKPVGEGLKPSPTNKHHGLFEIIRGFKTFSSKAINLFNPVHKFHWQRSYYDRIIRNEKELLLIRQYIQNNPLKWWRDRNNFINSH